MTDLYQDARAAGDYLRTRSLEAQDMLERDLGLIIKHIKKIPDASDEVSLALAALISAVLHAKRAIREVEHAHMPRRGLEVLDV